VYGCQTGSVTLRDGYRLSDFQKLLLRNIFWAKEEKKSGSWKRMGDDELCNCYSSPNIIPLPKSGWKRRAQITTRAGETTDVY
jgi:hypothetical protein